MKKYILLIVAGFVFTASRAQTTYNFARFGVGFETGLTHGYTNVNIQHDNRLFNFNVNYYYTPFIPLTAEFQYGRLSGGSIISDPHKRQYLNNYKALVLHGDLELGEIIDYRNNFFLNLAKNFYVGTGFGVIRSDLKVQRYSLNDPNYIFPGKDESSNFMLPLRFGYEIKLFNPYGEPFIRIGLGYEHNIVFGGGLDGYTDPSSRFRNKSPDQYREITVGIKLNFGSIATYDRQQ